jgi:hypothetical protein
MRDLAERLAPEMVERGALAVVLTGSHARGDATEASDLDLIGVGDGPAYLLEVREGVLVAQSWASEHEHGARMGRPGQIGSAVPGWREAVILHDSAGIAAGLQRGALDWTWGPHAERCDAWVAEQVAGLAEEVGKLAAALDHRGRTLMAAVQRDLLALRLAPVLAVHLRLLYGSENVLWERVGGLMGGEWRAAQAAAFGTGGQSFAESCAAAFRLYRLAADRVASLLDGRQAAVVAGALVAAGGFS